MNTIKIFFLAVDLFMEVFTCNKTDKPSAFPYDLRNIDGSIQNTYSFKSSIRPSESFLPSACADIELADLLEESDESNHSGPARLESQPLPYPINLNQYTCHE